MATADAYVYWTRRYVLFHGKRHPRDLGVPEVVAFLRSLALDSGVSASTQNQAHSALLFLYREVLDLDLSGLDDVVRARLPKTVPVVLSRGEVARVLGQLDGVPLLQVSLLYGAGLRLMECLMLRVKDVDLERAQLLIRRGKGNRDRVTMLPVAVRSPLSEHMEGVREQHQRDVREGAGWVALPDALSVKYPGAGREWGWQWAFPASRTYVERVTGERRRHHVHETTLQRQVRDAVRRAGIGYLLRQWTRLTASSGTARSRCTTTCPS